MRVGHALCHPDRPRRRRVCSRSTGLDLSRYRSGDPSSFVQVRREGERQEVAVSRAPELDRHEVSDLYARLLQHSVRGAGPISGLPAIVGTMRPRSG